MVVHYQAENRECTECDIVDLSPMIRLLWKFTRRARALHLAVHHFAIRLLNISVHFIDSKRITYK